MNMNPDNNLEHGFDIFERSQKLSLDFIRAGRDGAISFVKAAISLGYVRENEIIEEACAIGGDHLKGTFKLLLSQGEDLHWDRGLAGELSLI